MRTVPRSRAALAVVAVLAAIVIGGAAGCTSGGGPPASAVPSRSPATPAASSPGASATSAPGGQTVAALCNSQRRAVVGGVYMVQNNEWGSGAPECVAVGARGGFTVSKSAIANSPGGSPGGYPSIYRGCHWGLCTPRSGLPVQASKLLSPGTVTTSWATAQPGTGSYDVAYDIWFNKTPTTSGQPNGAELMIWINHNGPVEPYGSQASTATIGGRSYQVWFGQQGWNTISYSMVPGTTSVRDLDIGQFVADAIHRGWIQKSWYLIDVEAGFEIWQGGAGLATDSFAVNVPGDSSAPVAAGLTAAQPAVSSAPAAAGGSCAVTYSVANTWPGGFQAQAVLTNTSARPLSGWTLAWSFPGDQRVTDLWDGDYTQSGKRVSVTNASYDAAIAPSSSVTIGFNGSGSGNDPPAAFQLNGANCSRS
jgi:Glycosyl hydrolase family 12/Cellulose binding domain